MTNIEIDLEMAVTVKSERKITRRVLELIQLAEKQRLPEERGFKDTYDWLIRGHGYSGGAANRRIQASRLLAVSPEIVEKVESGALNLTSLWQAQKAIRSEQKVSGRKVSPDEKREALKRIENKTTRQVDQELGGLFPNAQLEMEKITAKRDGGVTLTLQLTAEESAELERSRELLSHALPGGTSGQLVARLAREFNQRKDPLRTVNHNRPVPVATMAQPIAHRDLVPTPGRVKSGFAKAVLNDKPPSKAATRIQLIQKAGGRCSYIDARSGRQCGSRFQLELDHIVPRAKGGSDDPSNLRCLCRRHNQLMAEMEFGREFMARKRDRKIGDIGLSPRKDELDLVSLARTHRCSAERLASLTLPRGSSHHS